MWNVTTGMDSVTVNRVIPLYTAIKVSKCKCNLLIIVVSALSFPRYRLTKDQLVYGRATQTTETNIANQT